MPISMRNMHVIDASTRVGMVRSCIDAHKYHKHLMLRICKLVLVLRICQLVLMLRICQLVLMLRICKLVLVLRKM
jgi:hypothetical protein